MIALYPECVSEGGNQIVKREQTVLKLISMSIKKVNLCLSLMPDRQCGLDLASAFS